MAMNRRWAAPAAAGILAIALAIQLWGAVPVLAHAPYQSSSPAKGARVPISLARVEVTFTGDIRTVTGAYDLQVNRDRGGSVTAGPPAVDDADRSKLSVPLRPNLDAGRYVVRWKNVSDDDDDPAEGAFSFYIGDYTPTTVDLENDARLELVGAEAGATTAAGDTPGSSADTPAAGPTTVRTQGPGLTPAAGNGAESDTNGGDGPNITIIVLASAAVAAVAAVAGFLLARRRP
jgi:methionine-rich copper-binding protein CopC